MRASFDGAVVVDGEDLHGFPHQFAGRQEVDPITLALALLLRDGHELFARRDFAAALVVEHLEIVGDQSTHSLGVAVIEKGLE